MFISRVTITGFKSFAAKTSFSFKPGVSAIVGPNGSGKSNVSDAVRWVFGEQSAKLLRVKKSEDVIFAGTGNKARGSVAEVQLVFDNGDGSLTGHGVEVQLSRKLYGSGESEYRINTKKVRLQDIQELLAKARVGAGSYAIIGQGTIDSLVMSSPAERKLLFEEASGIREFELKREQAVRRLRATADNMEVARKVLAELEPRLEHLERSLSGAKKRDELAEKVSGLKVQIEVARYQELRRSADVSETMIGRLTKELEDNRSQLQHTQQQLEALASQQKDEDKSRQEAAKSLDSLEAERDHLGGELGLKRAELSHIEERQKEANGLTAELEKVTHAVSEQSMKVKELEMQLHVIQGEQQALVSERKKSTQLVRSVQTKLVQQRNQLSEAAPHEYITHAQSVLQELTRTVGGDEVDLEAVKLLTYKVRRLLTLAAMEGQGEALEALKDLQAELTTAIRIRELAEERYGQATLRLRSQELNLEAARGQSKTLVAQQKRLSKALDPFTKMAEHAAARAEGLEVLQERLETNKQAIEDARRLLRSQNDTGETASLAAAVERLQFHISRLEAELGQANSEKADLTAQLRAFGTQLLKQASTAKAMASVSTLEHDLVASEARLQALSEIEGNVAGEHAEVSQRHGELQQQINDLDKAHQDLTDLTDQLDAAIAAQFESGFQQISEAFSRTFAELFGGGSAQLSLDKGSDGLGIQIEVSPPGKRVKHLGALSGGERSMAGIALLVAIIQAHPSPVLVLDEVDAALDESNSERFQKLLQQLSGSSQILVITHNRQTMAAAERLYGVTMDSQHVSRMVAVELPEAQEMAEAIT